MTVSDSRLTEISGILAGIAAELQPLTPTPTPTPPVPTPPPVSGHFSLLVDENFSTGSLDTKVWWRPYDGTKGTANVGTRKGSLCTWRNGNLIIAAERPSAISYDWNTFFSTGVAMGPVAQTYGRWEVRQKASPGAGFWPNLQLWPTAGKQAAKFAGKDGWPETIEVDICECPEADRQTAHTTIHYGAGNTQAGSTIKGDFTQFHEWAVEWTPDALAFFLDGNEIRRVTNKSMIPTTPHHLVIQSDQGPWAGKPNASDPVRVEIEVDYVRQYAFKP